MRIALLLIAGALTCSCAITSSVSLTNQSLTGAWRCGPTTMHGPDFDIDVTTETTYAPDHTFTSSTTSVITPHGKTPITTRDRSYGTWRLDGDIVTSNINKAEFLLSSDSSIGIALGQHVLDDQLKKKSIYQSRILEFTESTSRSIPVNSMYKEAVVESSCVRA